VFLPLRVAEAAALTAGRPGAPVGGRVREPWSHEPAVDRARVDEPRVEVLLRSGHVLRLLGSFDRAAWGELIAALEQSRVAAGRVAAGRVAAGRVAAGRVAAGRVAATAGAVEPEDRC
jgi:hypothetical protein